MLQKGVRVQLSPTFLRDIRISRSAPTGSFFEQERRDIKFESKVAQYCSSCTLESWIGTQYSTNFEESDFRSYAINFANLSLRTGSASTVSLESIFKLSTQVPSPTGSRNDSRLRYSGTLSWKSPKLNQSMHNAQDF